MKTERRSQQRFRLARMGLFDLGRERFISAQGNDVSRSGMAFVSDEYAIPETRVWLSFSIPEPDGFWRESGAALEAFVGPLEVVGLEP